MLIRSGRIERALLLSAEVDAWIRHQAGMSIKAMHWAWNQPVGSTTGKLVLLKLADNANEDGCGFPSVALIARQCEINERTVQRTIRHLEAAGHLRVQARYYNGRRTSNAYYLNVSDARGGNVPPPVLHRSNPGAAPPPPPAATTFRGDIDVTLTTIKPPIKESPLQPRRNSGFEQLCFPNTLPEGLRIAAQRMLSELPFELAQLVADEWSGYLRQGNVRNPMAYLATLIQRARAGRFTPELAKQERARRHGHGSAAVVHQLARRWRNTAAREDMSSDETSND